MSVKEKTFLDQQLNMVSTISTLDKKINNLDKKMNSDIVSINNKLDMITNSLIDLKNDISEIKNINSIDNIKKQLETLEIKLDIFTSFFKDTGPKNDKKSTISNYLFNN